MHRCRHGARRPVPPFLTRRPLRGLVTEALPIRGFQRDDRVLLVEWTDDGAGRSHLVLLDGTTSKIGGLGILNTAKLEGMEPGDAYSIGGRGFRLFRPTVKDLVDTVKRRAQIVLPKDAAQIIFQCGIGPGSRVVEAGIGSAALSIALASAIGPDGHLFNYELREDFQKVGRQNLERADLLDRCTLKLGDPSGGIEETDLDAAVWDLPQPWDVVATSRSCLAPGGRFAAYTPSVQQMEKAVRALRDGGFFDVRSQEVLVREWHVGTKGVRPEFEMLGHTAWLTFARSPGPE